MSGFTFSEGAFPAGASVQVVAGIDGSRASQQMPPDGLEVVQTFVMDDDATHVTGLGSGNGYWAVSQVNGTWRWVRFRADPAAVIDQTLQLSDLTDADTVATDVELEEAFDESRSKEPVNLLDFDLANYASENARWIAAVNEANSSERLLYAPGGVYQPGALPVFTGSPGLIGDWGKTVLQFNQAADCVVLKGTLKSLSGLYIQNFELSHGSLHGVVRIRNCAHGRFSDLFVASNGNNNAGIILEHVYDGSLEDAAFLAHDGCWGNRFTNTTVVYILLAENTGYGVMERVDASAIGILNPPGQSSGTYDGHVGHSDWANLRVEGQAVGFLLDRSNSTRIGPGLFLGSEVQVQGVNSASSNTFDTVKFNQPVTTVFNFDSSCLDNKLENPVFFPSDADLGNLGGRSNWSPSPSQVITPTGTPTGTAFAADWSTSAGFTPAAFYRDGANVCLAGAATKATSAADGDVIFTLPVNFRPGAQEDFVVWTVISGTPAMGRLRVLANGQVQWLGGAGAAGSSIGFSGVTFRAGS